MRYAFNAFNVTSKKNQVFVFEKNLSLELINNVYRAFHRFGQAKFPDGGSILGSRQFSILLAAPAASKNTARFKSGQNQQKKIIISLH